MGWLEEAKRKSEKRREEKRSRNRGPEVNALSGHGSCHSSREDAELTRKERRGACAAPSFSLISFAWNPNPSCM